MAFAIHSLPKKGRQLDLMLLFAFIILLGLGLGVLFSASYYRADTLFSDPLRFVRNQAVYAALGTVLALLTIIFPLEYLRKCIPLFLLISFGLMILTFVPGIGVEYLGARRQIQFGGYTFQPTELVKLTLILYLAYILGKKERNLDDVLNNLLPPVIIVMLFITLIYLQNDFSSAVLIGFIALSMFFIAGVKLKYFAALITIAIPLGLILLLSREHRVIRVISFLDPNRDPSGAGYQVLASLSALQNGGLWGMGLGKGVQKLGSLPEAQSDFVFAVLGEELGFMGVLGVLAVFAMLAWRGYAIALRQQSPFYRLLAYGITSLITIQAGINMAVISGMVPPTGIPMPFFAAGGSHLLLTMILCGLLLNISRRESSIEEGRVSIPMQMPISETHPAEGIHHV